MGALEDIETRLAALEFRTPDDAQAWLDSVVLPKAQTRRVEAWIKEWRTKLGRDLIARLAADAASIAEQWATTEEQLNEGIRRTLEIQKLGETGRISKSDEMLGEIQKVVRRRTQILDVQRALHDSIQSWNAMSDGTAEDLEAARHERFPAAHTRQRLTGAYLLGEEESPFRKGGE